MNAIDFLFAAALDIAKSSSAKYDDYDEDYDQDEDYEDNYDSYDEEDNYSEEEYTDENDMDENA